MWDFFIAYSKKDEELALKIYDELQPSLKVFIDSKCIPLGSDWDIIIPQEQSQSKCTLALISSNIQQAYYAREEIAKAVVLTRAQPDMHKLIPVFIGEVSPENIPYGLRLKQGISITSTNLKEVKKQLSSLITETPLRNEEAQHYLSNFPRGPMVPANLIKRGIIEAYAELLRPYEFNQVISEANAFRLEADVGVSNVTTLKIYSLPPYGTVPPLQYWIEAFNEARLHGPRMLAALLQVVPDDYFSDKVKKQKIELLQKLMQ